MELPPTPRDITAGRVDDLAERVDWVLLDTNGVERGSGLPLWRPSEVDTILRSFARAGFDRLARERGVIILVHQRVDTAAPPE